MNARRALINDDAGLFLLNVAFGYLYLGLIVKYGSIHTIL